jgi:hypothetical protein
MSSGEQLDEVVTNVNANGQYTTDLPAMVHPNVPLVIAATREASATALGRCEVDATLTPLDTGPPADFSTVAASIRVTSMQVALRYAILYDMR